MKIKDSSEIKSLYEMVGKLAYFRTSRGKSLPHVIEYIELTNDEILFVLKNKHSTLTKKRRASVVELIDNEDKINRRAQKKTEEAEKKADRVAEKKAEKKEVAEEKLTEKIAEVDRLNKIAREHVD
jgi:hypothetical protein